MTGSSLLADRYRIEREIGRGGMAVVYLAHDTRHERKVALKFIADELASAVGTQRFLQEIKVTAALQHPHVLSVYDSGVTPDKRLYYVMPHVDGGSLRARMEQAGPLPLADAVTITREVADALAYAHERGIVHRDIKPENILFSGGHALVSDFGIARLATEGTSQQLTVQGVVVGTPAYMSPEQGFGAPVDSRSDVYSLAVVVYEMLTAKVPFSSPAAGSWTQFGLMRMPPPLLKERPDLPAAVEEVLVRALAPSVDDRYPGAREFAQRLEHAAGSALTGTVPSPARTTGTRSRRAWRRGMLFGTSFGVLALVLAGLFSPSFRSRLVAFGIVDVDPATLMVAPFQAPAELGAVAARAEGALRAELARWSGLTVVSRDATHDALGGEATLDDALRGARRARAGLMVWTRVRRDGADSVIEAHVFSARSGTSLMTHSAPVPASDSAWTAWGLASGAAFLAGPAVPAIAMRAAGATRSLAAWRGYARGHRALQDWNLAAADSAFRDAVAADARFPQARVWLAQAQVWGRRAPRADWRRHADQALMLAASLDLPDRTIAEALAAIGRRDEPLACERYAAFVVRDSHSVVGWMGLGDCRALDDVVVRDRRSPSGYAFRGNFRAALEAYEQAVRLSPRAYAALPLAFVEKLLPTQADRFRPGVSADDSTRYFAAQPAPSGDSVVYVPHPIRNALPPDPPGFEEALQRNRARMLEYVAAWTQRLPDDADAQEALAGVQEQRGELLGVAAAGRSSALVALDSALRLATDPVAKTRISAARVRVLIKAGAFRRAAGLADSLLDHPAVGAREAYWLAGIAAVTGRTREAARLARLGGADPLSDWDTLPAPVGEAATLLFIRAASGACTDDFRASVRRVEELIANYTVPAYREPARLELTERARRLAAPCLGHDELRAMPAYSSWERMQQRFAAGDTAGVRAIFDTLVFTRRYRQPGGVALDYSFTAAWLLAAIGDTATALRHLDHTLNALPTMSRHSVQELGQSAALVRAMIWRADLARATGDVQNASRWAAAAALLWNHADPELQPAVERMRTIAESR